MSLHEKPSKSQPPLWKNCSSLPWVFFILWIIKFRGLKKFQNKKGPKDWDILRIIVMCTSFLKSPHISNINIIKLFIKKSLLWASLHPLILLFKLSIKSTKVRVTPQNYKWNLKTNYNSFFSNHITIYLDYNHIN
jgi:hypothetical protein